MDMRVCVCMYSTGMHIIVEVVAVQEGWSAWNKDCLSNVIVFLLPTRFYCSLSPWIIFHPAHKVVMILFPCLIPSSYICFYIYLKSLRHDENVN